MGWVGGVVSSVSCQTSLRLSPTKDDFVWAGSSLDQNPVLPAVSFELPTPSK